MAYENPIDLDRYIARAIERVHKRQTKAGDIDADLTRANAEKVWEGVKSGFKKEVKSYNYGSHEQRLLLQMRHNVHVAAAFKNHHNTLAMVNALFDEKGNPRDFAAFKKEALKINKDYNKNWLKAEYDLATKSASWGEQWKEFERRGGKLEYRTQRDGNVRDAHRVLDGTLLPVDHAFWNTWFPPNGWGCRCFVRRRSDSHEDKQPAGVPDDMPPMFRNNVGKTGQVFTKDSPYFEVDGRFKEKADKLFGHKPPVDIQKFNDNINVFEALKESKEHILTHTNNSNGSFVFRHVRANKKEVENLIPVSKAIADKETSAIIINKVDNVPGIKNPDLTINGAFAEVKSNYTATANAIDLQLKEASKQAGLVILNIESTIAVNVLEMAIYNRVQRASRIKEVKVLYNGEVYTLTRDEIISKSFFGKME